ncbi:MAG: nucleotidyltransferase substrate binding protein [Verrucomicrobiota bacterium]|nr:nucleotidyltransferase substrate binding protein [Verrucomicrobiota bacterium]
MATATETTKTRTLESFGEGLSRLGQALERGTDGLNQLEKEGAIHRFEHCLELAWKATREFLESAGLFISPVTPREVFRQAATAKAVDDGQVWIDMLNHRTFLAHSFDGVVFAEVIEAVEVRYLPALQRLHQFLACP